MTRAALYAAIALQLASGLLLVTTEGWGHVLAGVLSFGAGFLVCYAIGPIRR